SFHWDTNGNSLETIFYAEVSSVPGFAPRITSTTLLENADLTGLIPNTTYWARVFARNHAGSNTETLDFPSTTTWANQPLTMVANGVSSTSLRFEWTSDNPGGTVFFAWISSVPGFASNIHSSQTVLANATFYSLIPNTTYWARVKAIGHNGNESGYLDFATGITLAAVPDVTAFSGITKSTIAVAWADNGNPSYTAYELSMSSDSNFLATVSTPVTFSHYWMNPSTTVVKLMPQTTYFFRLRAINAGGLITNFSASTSAATVPDLIAPAQITSLEVLGPSALAQLPLRWSSVGDDAMADPLYGAYQIQYSSFAVSWSTNTAQVSFSTSNVAPGAQVSYLVSDGALAPNASYYAVIWAQDMRPNWSPLSNMATGATLANPAGALAAPFTSVDMSSVGVSWFGSGNPADTPYLVIVTTYSYADSALAISSKTIAAANTTFTNLALNTNYNFFAQSYNRQGLTAGSWTALGSTYTLAGAPAMPSESVFAEVLSASVTVRWSANGNPPGTEYLAQASTSSDFAGTIRSSAWVSTFAAGVPGLIGDMLYYFRVQARNGAGRTSGFLTLGSTRTLISIVDEVAPGIIVNIAGDNNWRGKNTTAYNVDFEDYGGSGLSKFQVRAATASGEAQTYLTDWTDVAVSLPTPYAADWSLPASVWSSLSEGATNYISVRAYDVAGNSATVYGAFYVLKDITAPAIAASLANVTSAPKTYGYYNSDQGAVFDVDFNDSLSKLHTIQYSVSSASGAMLADVIGWTQIWAPPINSTSYSANWALNFDGLLDGATNFVSVRAWDYAGSTATLLDAFIVLKDTSGPMVAISVPSSTHRSSLGAVSGTAFDYVGIKGVELSIEDLSAARYWNGSSFIAVMPYWLKANGQTSWALDTTIIPWSNNTSYRIVARSSDTAGLFTVVYASAVFGFDTTAPLANVTLPAGNSIIESLAVISGTASDAGAGASGPALTEIMLRRNSDGLWWNFSANSWGSVQVSTAAVGETTWTFAVPDLLQADLAHGASYYLTARAQDKAVPANQGNFNIVAATDSAYATFVFRDVTPPAAISYVKASTPTDTPGQVQLEWLPTADNGESGLLIGGLFAIQYATFSQGVVWSTASVQTTKTFGQLVPGTTQTLLIGSLVERVTHYFVIWTKDSDGNWSAPSISTPSIIVPGDPTAISGKVTQSNGQGLSGIVVEIIDPDTKLPAVKTLTEANGTGEYRVANLVSGKKYTVKVTWTSAGITSSVSKDEVPTGTAKLNFTLGVSYTLGSISGALSLSPAVVQALQAKESRQESGLGARYSALAQGSGGAVAGGEPFVEISAGGQVVARTPVDSSANYEIKNLMPGEYTIMGFNGRNYSEPQKVSLGEGQAMRVALQWQILVPESVFSFPNPAQNEATLRFIANVPSIEAGISIFDVAGNLVREIGPDEIKDSGTGIWRARWDTTNMNGDRVASGVYIFIVYAKDTTNGKTEKVVKKLAIIR
ncbi:MAG: hypothetical protein HY747_03310, partial [Elusimicrobia bacterium]|nr:hypothetical protein [Elusimicrobiota bacterium]